MLVFGTGLLSTTDSFSCTTSANFHSLNWTVFLRYLILFLFQQCHSQIWELICPMDFQGYWLSYSNDQHFSTLEGWIFPTITSDLVLMVESKNLHSLKRRIGFEWQHCFPHALYCPNIPVFLRGGFSLMMALHSPSIVLSLSSSFLRGGFSLMMALHSPSIVENRESLWSKVLSGASDIIILFLSDLFDVPNFI